MEVNGSNAAPLYKYLKSVKSSIFGDSIKWNFSKFLVDKDGHVVDRYAPTTSPLSIEVNLVMQLINCSRSKEKKLAKGFVSLSCFVLQKDIKKLIEKV